MTKEELVLKWYEMSQDHLLECTFENCTWYWEFVRFEIENKVTEESTNDR